MQIKVVCHKTGKITGNRCIFAIFNISINIWSRETKLISSEKMSSNIQ